MKNRVKIKKVEINEEMCLIEKELKENKKKKENEMIEKEVF